MKATHFIEVVRVHESLVRHSGPWEIKNLNRFLIINANGGFKTIAIFKIKLK